jgi:cobalt-zinc-cadmium efflux system protein
MSKKGGAQVDRHHHNHDHGGEGNIRLAFFLNLSFTIAEIIGGILTNSMAILSDALHDLGDSISLGMAWYFQRFSRKGPDAEYSFGYARFSLLGALINSVVLVAGSALVLSRSIPRIFRPQEVHPEGMVLFALLGILVNGAAVLRLRKGKSLNEKVVSWHLLEDVLGWIAVLIAGVVMLFADLPVLDPLLSVGITLFVLFNVLKNVRELMRVLLQGVPRGVSVTELEEAIGKVPHVAAVYHTHLWSLEGERNQLTTHILVEDDAPADQIIAIKENIQAIASGQGIDHVTIQVDFPKEGPNRDFVD